MSVSNDLSLGQKEDFSKISIIPGILRRNLIIFSKARITFLMSIELISIIVV
ncbi:MAG: hypothetical protein ACTHJ7_02975 [Candidatus Nitrosocosmicus sp.]